MKIEIEAKELTALLDYIKGQREPIGNADDLAKSIDVIVSHVRTTCDEHGCSVNIQPCVENANWKA